MRNPGTTSPPDRVRRRERLFPLALALMLGVSVALILAAAEWLAGRKIAATPDFPELRRRLGGETPAEEGSFAGNIVPLPYMLYGCAPGFEARQHNAHGYRGPVVPVRRKPGAARVLFLGGSTTYGWGVSDWRDTCAAMTEARLNADPPAGFESVEVINAGVPNATSAELFAHYVFKYRYYAPDVVVIQTGGNDARVMERPFYSPDYAHDRETPYVPGPLAPEFRVVLRSNIASLFLMRMLPGGGAGRERFRPRERRSPAAVDWFAGERGSGPDAADIPDSELAFAVNIRSLIREIRADGAAAALVPFQHQPYDRWPELAELTDRTEAVLKDLAAETGARWIPFPYEEMPEGGWADICHTTREGNRFKTDSVGPAVRELLERRAAAEHTPPDF